MSFPVFSRRKFPQVGGRKHESAGTNRSPDRRDYDHKWERLSIAFRRKNPFCRFCAQEGFECTPADDVDHVIPIEDGGARLDWSNLQPICRRHHNGLKFRLQQHARKHGLIDQLPKWCADPSTRPNLTIRHGENAAHR